MKPLSDRVDEAVAVQRLARMRQVWQREQPDGTELDGAYRRFRQGQVSGGASRAGTGELAVGWHFAMGMAIGCVALVAIRLASGGASPGSEMARRVGEPGPALVARAPEVKAGTALGSAVAFVQRGAARTGISQPTKFEVAAGEVVSVTLGDAVREFEGPGVVEIVIAPGDVSGWSCEFTPLLGGALAGAVTGTMKVGEVRETPRRGSASEPAPDAGWAEVARALGAGDTAAASRGLEKLSRSSSQKTRDAAKLALAQLWASQGDSARARPVLTELAQSGATEVVRARAKEALKVGAR